MRAKSTPKGYHSLTPFLIVDDVRAVVAFVQAVFDAETPILREVDGRLLLAGVLIGDSHLMIADRRNDDSPHAGGHAERNSVGLRVYVDDADATFGRALARGARQVAAMENQFYGDRTGTVIDPFGFTWRISQNIEDLPHDEIERRMHRALDHQGKA